jgi:predicted ATPase
MIPRNRLSETHLRIGRNLKEHCIKSDQICFEICNHIGKETSLLLQNDEKKEMVLMNLQAARKAMTRVAYEYALKYSLAARHLSESIGIKIDQITKLGINQVIVQALFSLARYDDALNESEAILRSTTHELARIVIGGERIRALRSLGRNNEAYEHGMKVIQLFGLRVPNDIYSTNQIMSLCKCYRESIDREESIQVLS